MVPRLIAAMGTIRERFRDMVELKSYTGIGPVMRQTETELPGRVPVSVPEVCAADVSGAAAQEPCHRPGACRCRDRLTIFQPEMSKI